MAWAIEQQEVTEPVTRLVLICLANYTSIDGTNGFPSVLRLSRDTGLSERAVQTHLRKLEKLLIIRRGNPALAVATISRKDRIPVVYNIIMERGAPPAPRKPTGCTPRRNGVHMTTSRGAPSAPDPEILIRHLTDQNSIKKAQEEAEKIGFRKPLPNETAEAYRMAILKRAIGR